MTISKHGVARVAAGRLTSTRIEAVAGRYADWIDSKEFTAAAMDALMGASEVSKSPERVLTLADQLYDQMDDYAPESVDARLKTLEEETMSGGADFVSWAIRQGYQRFFQPRTVAPELTNAAGWIDAPSSGDLVIPLYELPGDADKTMYWIYESIVTRSTSSIRMALEGNFQWTPETGFVEENWQLATGYVVSDVDGHQMEATMIKTVPGEAMRLRIYGATGQNNDFYFKFIGLELPFRE